MRETRLESVLALRAGGLPAPLAAYLVARAAEAVEPRPRILTVAEIRVREDGEVKLVRGEGAPPFGYRAPEVVQGGAEGDMRASVFSLGIALIHTALGRSPFERDTDLETRIAVGEDPIPELCGRAGKASAALDAILAQACAKQADRRHASPAELAAALDGYLEDELHEVGPQILAAAVREAIERSPSHDRTSMPDYDDAELAFAPPVRPHHAPAEPLLDEDLVRLGDPLLTDTAAGVTEASLTGVRDSGPHVQRPEGLDIDGSVVAGAERARVNKTLAPIRPEAPPGPNWLLRGGLLLLALVAASIAYQFVLRPLLGD